MQRWLKRWYGVTVRPRMTEHDMHATDELEGASGAAFELRFMSHMTVHHTLAVERAGIAARRASHAQVRRLARGIVRAQEREIDQFREWTVAWYARLTGRRCEVSRCRPGDTPGRPEAISDEK
ncbi:MAG: DUF305 domain-containing protein [Solirubrobacteraceae bacterium]